MTRAQRWASPVTVAGPRRILTGFPWPPTYEQVDPTPRGRGDGGGRSLLALDAALEPRQAPIPSRLGLDKPATCLLQSTGAQAVVHLASAGGRAFDQARVIERGEMLGDGLAADRQRGGERGHAGGALPQQRLDHPAPSWIGERGEDLADMVAQAHTRAKLAASAAIGNAGMLSVTSTRVPDGAATTRNSTRVAGSSGDAHHQKGTLTPVDD